MSPMVTDQYRYDEPEMYEPSRSSHLESVTMRGAQSRSYCILPCFRPRLAVSSSPMTAVRLSRSFATSCIRTCRSRQLSRRFTRPHSPIFDFAHERWMIEVSIESRDMKRRSRSLIER
jgi:hypothetical protein